MGSTSTRVHDISVTFRSFTVVVPRRMSALGLLASWLSVATVSVTGCTLTSDLDELREFAEACDGNPSAPGCGAAGSTSVVTSEQCSDVGLACQQGFCDAARRCRPMHCWNDVVDSNEGETDEDCGGSCEPCADGRSCSGNGDCASGICGADGSCGGALPDRCANLTVDLETGESDEDCGGTCNPCSPGKNCNRNADCELPLLCVVPALGGHAVCASRNDPGGGSGGVAGAGGANSQPLEDGGVGAVPLDSGVDPRLDAETACGELKDAHGCKCVVSWDNVPYAVCREPLSWSEAGSFCQNEPGFTLAAVTSRTVNDLLVHEAKEPVPARLWLGGSDSSSPGSWIWADNGDVFWQGGPATCPGGSSEFRDNKTCYAVVQSPGSYNNGFVSCSGRGIGWSLARLKSGAENDYVTGLMKSMLDSSSSSTTAWIGANDLRTEGEWGWVTGSTDVTDVNVFWLGARDGSLAAPGTFVSWNQTSPAEATVDGDCAFLSETGSWFDGPCSASRPSICEGPKTGPVGTAYAAMAANEPAAEHCLALNTNYTWSAANCETRQAFACSARALVP